ncbi:type II secretion system F family protein [Mycetocola sp. 2940]|uniref:type II secretion system F family protein n=1 Tax=Mycetocola sp. 2940 TaxID=3156452 RepID=UPI0033921B5A
MTSTDRTPPIERVAGVTARLAVLLSAGVPPVAAWGYLAADDVSAGPGARSRSNSDPAGIGRVLSAAAAAAQKGADVAVAIAEAAADTPEKQPRKLRTRLPPTDAWLTVAAAWSVATETGAPLAGCLHELARSQRALGQAQRDIDAALAGPRSTSRLVLMLPVVGLLFGVLLGFDTVGTLVGTVPGWFCLAGGTLLMLAAWRWSRAMVSRSTPRSSAPGLAIDLTAIAMSSGASVDRAVAVVESALARFQQSEPTRPSARRRVVSDSPRLVGSSADGAAIRGVFALSRAAGVPAADLLRAEADQARRNARSNAQQAAASLATRLMLPLGLCILPAFLLVGVAPLMLSVLSSTVRGIG